MITKLTSRQFNQDASGAKRASTKGPVFITDRGKLAHVLLNIEDYQMLISKQDNIVTLLAMPESSECDFEAPKLDGSLYHPEEFD